MRFYLVLWKWHFVSINHTIYSPINSHLDVSNFLVFQTTIWEHKGCLIHRHQRPHVTSYQTREPLLHKGGTGMHPGLRVHWSYYALHHLTCWPERTPKWPPEHTDEGPSWRQHSVRTEHDFSRCNIRIESKTLIEPASLVRRLHGFGIQIDYQGNLASYPCNNFGFCR